MHFTFYLIKKGLYVHALVLVLTVPVLYNLFDAVGYQRTYSRYQQLRKVIEHCNCIIVG